jgi:DNA-binding response OmpR family regulator
MATGGTDPLMIKRQTILVVEDDADLRRMFRSALAFAGYEVREASDGTHALRMIDEKRPDLVVLDLMLPLLGGLAVQQEIASHAQTQNIPIVIVTGSTMSLEGIDVPCILRKPVSPDELVRVVQTCLIIGARNAEL